jgi:ubiquinone/menaquinone biosynthesis C-methylase UbiE
MQLIIFSIISVVILMLILFLWRFLSTKYTLPCPTWLGWLVERDNPFTKIHHAATIIEHLKLGPGMTVLDVGCGPGRVTIPAAVKVGQSGEVVAMDIQEGMLEKVKEKAQKLNLKNIKYFHAALGENKLEKNKFDKVILVTVIGEIPKREEALKEIFDSLKPSGILSVTELIFDPHFQKRSVVINLATSVGFEEKERFGNAIAYTLHFVKPEIPL